MIKKNLLKSCVYFSLLVGGLMCIYSCNKTESNGINSQTSSLGYILANGTNTTIFNSAVIKAGLDTAFSGTSIFTLMVPNDLACTQSGYTQDVINGFTPEQARAWVLYMTYAGTALPFETFIGKTEVKLIMADGDSVFVSGDSNRTYVNGYQFLNSELAGSNGIMLALQNVLTPPDKTLEQIVSSDSTLSFLNEAILLSSPVPDSISTMLSTGGPYSFLAPVNDAFRSLGYTTPSDLSAVNPDSLRTMVLLGLVPQRLFSYDVGDSAKIQTVNGDTLFFTHTGIFTAVQVLGDSTTASGDSAVSNIIASNIMAINGVLYKIDSVLGRKTN